MFKKEVNERSRTLLKNKDSRAFKQNLVEQFQGVDADSLSDLFSSKSQQVYMGKIGSGTKDVLYSISETEPIVIDLNSKNELLPTLYFLSKFPRALRQFVVHSPVSEFVLKGADLMMPGVCTAEGLEGISLDELVAIRVRGNPVPFAVGVSLVSWEGIQCNGMRGRAARIIHCYGDMMCQKWNRNAPINEGFSLTRIRPLPGYEEIGALADRVDTEGNDEDSDSDDGNARREAQQKANADTPEGGADEGVLPPEGEEGGEKDAEAEDDLASAVECVAVGDGDGDPITDKEMDAALETYLLRALYYIVKDKHLPILVSSLWALLLRCSLEGEPKPDIKKSSAKKVSSLLQRYSEGSRHRTAGLLRVVHEENGISSIVTIDRSHDSFKFSAGEAKAEMVASEKSEFFNRVAEHGYRVPDVEAFRLRLRPLIEGDSATTDAPTEGGKGVRGKFGAMKVVELYRPTKPFREMLGGSVIGEYGDCLTAAEVRNVMLSYVASKAFPVVEGGASVEIPSDDPLYKHIQLVKRIPQDDGKASAAIVPPKPPSATTTNGDDSDEQFSDDDGGCMNAGATGGVIAGVYMPSVSDFIQQASAPISLVNNRAAASVSSAGNTDSRSTRELLAEKGTGKPVELPKAAPRAVKKTVTATPPTKDGKPEGVARLIGTDKLGKSSRANGKSDEAALEGPRPPVVIQKKDVVKETLTRFAPYYGVVNSNGECHVSSGAIPQVQIDAEKRSGNKMVTKLSGLTPFGIDGNALARECQKKFACSASFAASTSRLNVMEITIQGFVADELSQLLVENYGIPKTVIAVKMAKGVKSKKKN